MKVLIVSYRFPPFNSIGAVRVGKTAKFLSEFGHDVRVLTADNQPLAATLATEIEPDHVTRTKWLNVAAPAEVISGGRKKVAEHGYMGGRSNATVQALRRLYKSALAVPDAQIGWYPYAVREGKRIVGRWRPDIVLASALPATSLLVGSAIARSVGVPWVAELRDLWVANNAYYEHGRLRRGLEARLERRTLSTASGLVTVSQPLAESLESNFNLPTAVILNGYDPADLAFRDDPPNGSPVRIVHTGTLYPNKRDPRALFEALVELDDDAKHVRIDFFGRNLDDAATLARRLGVDEFVNFHGAIPYLESLEQQASADVLLLLLWDDPREVGTFSGKVFEYIGTHRPILLIGPTKNVAAALLREREAGVTARSPTQIASMLRDWIAQKENRGAIPSTPETATMGLTRREQVRLLEEFLQQVSD